MEENVNDYLTTLSEKLQIRNSVARSLVEIANFPFAKGQCVYVCDYKKKEITFQNGVTELLGYEPEEFTFNHITRSYHPNDHDVLARILKATLLFSSENNVSSGCGLFLTYRMKHKDGHYIKMLRQSKVFEVDEEGRVISKVSILTDISFLDASDKVQWKFDAPGLDQKEFLKYITREYTGFFSDRELEVLNLLKEGATSLMIGKKLFISKHTVDGHRRKMLNKSNCSTTIDLINFSKISGLL